MENSKHVLSKIPIFSGLNEGQLEVLAYYEIEKSFKKGSVIFHEGEPGKAVFYVKTGRIKLFKTSIDGKEVTLNILGKGSIFAEVTMFSGLNYPATAMVMEDALIGMIRNNDIEQILLENGELALSLIKELNRRLYYAQSKIRDMALHDVNGRVAKSILDLAYRYGTKTDEGIEINFKMTTTEIANIVGTSRETLSRVLSQLKNDKVIEMKRKKLIVKSLSSLEDLSM